MNQRKYFAFDDMKRCIRILRPDTPQPWINYLSNGRFHAFVSQAGGGMAWWRSPMLFRLTRYRQYHLPIDSPGFYIYLREEDGTVWCPAWRPNERPLDHWEACHAPGITTFTAESNGLRATLSFFVSPDEDGLVWDLRILPLNGQSRQIDVFAYTELSQMLWSDETRGSYYNKLQLKTWYDDDNASVNYLFHAAHPKAREVPLVFFGANRPLHSWSGNRADFIGDYRTEARPWALEQGHCGNKAAGCGDPAAALHVRLQNSGTEELRTLFFLGVAPGALVDLPAACLERNRMLKRMLDPIEVDLQRNKLSAWWTEHFNVLQCRHSDPVLNRQINTWNVINSVHTGRYSRAVNTVAPGARGMGFRDSCQDMLAIAYRSPSWATRIFEDLLAHQYSDGHTVHTFYPEETNPPTLSIRSDNHLWLPLTAYAICAETNDPSWLDKKVPWYTGENTSPTTSGTIWEHLMAALHFSATNQGTHKIPLTFRSDWNDIIGRFNQHGRGESLFAALQFVYALRLMRELCLWSGKSDLSWLEQTLADQVAAVEHCGWDGHWWRRGFDDDGFPVGSVKSPAGNLFLNPQSWAVIAGVGTTEQLEAGMDAVHKQLDTGIGLKILTPSFADWSEGDEGDGPAPRTGYGPGCGENGAIFCHANTWAIMADALLGKGDRAWKTFSRLVPANAMQQVGIHRYRSEPYAWVSNIVGPENERFGWANVEQITGTAPWMDVVSTQYLLGLRPTLAGLRVQPCLPADSEGFEAVRRFRGTEFHITVHNRSGTGYGIRSATQDGQPLEICDGYITLKPGGESTFVKVEL
jgi:cellobiose phosphorylase